jgi:hypothetical protein
MQLPRLKMQQAPGLVAMASVWLWLQKINWLMVAIGTVVLALMHVSLRNRARAASEIEAEVGRARSLTLAGIIRYSIAVVLALAWGACIWTWQVFDHESLKNGARSDTPVRRAKSSP